MSMANSKTTISCCPGLGLGLFLFLLLCVIKFVPSSSTTAASNTASLNPPRLAIRLIHHDPVPSPYYDPNISAYEVAERAIEGSAARISSLHTRITGPGNGIRAGLIADNRKVGFLTKVFFGKPPVPQIVHVDTGSLLFWIQCIPCTQCFNQSTPVFDPTRSSTYSNLPCDSIDCQHSLGKCDRYKECTYNYSYARGSTIGNLASDIVSFDGSLVVPVRVFGCGHINVNSTRDWQESGILGLGYALYPSLVVQLGSKFSYCIGDVTDPKYPHNQLILGEGSTMEGDSTTLETFRGHYYVNLQGISVGEKTLDIDPQSFKRSPSGEGGVLVDTGSVLTWLQTDGYVPLQNEVQSLLDKRGLRRVIYGHNPALLCYAGTAEREVSDFPAVALHFEGGVKLNMDAKSFFFQRKPGFFCMAVAESQSSLNGLSLIGALAQQHHNFGYDIAGGKIFFKRIECQLLAE